MTRNTAVVRSKSEWCGVVKLNGNHSIPNHFETGSADLNNRHSRKNANLNHGGFLARRAGRARPPHSETFRGNQWSGSAPLPRRTGTRSGRPPGSHADRGALGGRGSSPGSTGDGRRPREDASEGRRQGPPPSRIAGAPRPQRASSCASVEEDVVQHAPTGAIDGRRTAPPSSSPLTGRSPCSCGSVRPRPAGCACG
jgi:hypothetical protein